MQTDYRECIAQAIGCGCRDEAGMLWVVFGRRLGVDLLGREVVAGWF